MQYLVFEFDNEEAMRDLGDKLWNQLGVSGEMSMRPITHGRFRMEVTSEAGLKESALEKFAQYRVENGD